MDKWPRFYLPLPHGWEEYIRLRIVQIRHVWILSPPLVKATAIIGAVVGIRLGYTHSLDECVCRTDMTGKTVIITGGNAGIGKATAMELAKRNAKVIIGCRNSFRGSQAAHEINAATGKRNVIFKELDLCSFESIRNFAQSIQESEGGLHVLVNNAGVAGTGGRRLITEDGCEHIMQANYLGHFLLTISLTDLMKKSGPSRIINVTSMDYKRGKLDVEDLGSAKDFHSYDVYRKSKLANILFTTELSEKLRSSGVTVNTANPGLSKTDFPQTTLPFQGFVMRMLYFFIGKTPFEGSQTIVHLALAPELEKASGKFFSNCKQKKLPKAAQDKDLAKKLFETSLNIVHLKK